MQFFTTILHIVLCITLILIILLQPGKDAGAVLGGGGGGGGNKMYGPRGQGHFLGKATTVVAATFMFTSITLAFYSRPRDDASTETLEAIRKLEQAGTEVSTESDSETERINDIRSTELDIDLEDAATEGAIQDGENSDPDALPSLDEVFPTLNDGIELLELDEVVPVDSDGTEE